MLGGGTNALLRLLVALQSFIHMHRLPCVLIMSISSALLHPVRSFHAICVIHTHTMYHALKLPMPLEYLHMHSIIGSLGCDFSQLTFTSNLSYM